jgi:hypothetical protein
MPTMRHWALSISTTVRFLKRWAGSVGCAPPSKLQPEKSGAVTSLPILSR